MIKILAIKSVIILSLFNGCCDHEYPHLETLEHQPTTWDGIKLDYEILDDTNTQLKKHEKRYKDEVFQSEIKPNPTSTL